MKIRLLVFNLLISSFAWSAADCIHCQSYLPLNELKPWPIEYIKVDQVQYERNSHASFCTRPLEIIDTIVLHHSETPSTVSAEKINDYHLTRGTATDPWYMIGYSYVINSAYPGASLPKLKVTEGRPLEIIGAHAGTNAFVPMSTEQKKIWDEKKVKCGKEGEEGEFDPSMVKDGKIKANVTTLGLVVIGNYAPFSKTNPDGYSRRKPRHPTKSTLDSVARMSCQLQKKHPRIKNIKWHNYYHNTSCPGLLKNYIGRIKALARMYGCEFN